MHLDTAIVDILADATRIAPTPGPCEHVTDWWPTWHLAVIDSRTHGADSPGRLVHFLKKVGDQTVELG